MAYQELSSDRDVGKGRFPVTRWSLVDVAAGDGKTSREALETICRDYWYPLYAFARRSGSSANDAEDLTQGFFLRLLENDWLSDVDQSKGKLRTFLLTAFRRFQANEWRRGMALSRGGGKVMLISELEGGDERYADAVPGLTAEELFDRQWALALLSKVLNELESEFTEAGQVRHYEILKNVLMAERGALNYAKLAEDLQTSEGAARVAAHRLRKRFRQKFRREIRLTLEADEDFAGEMAFLAKILAQ